MPGRRWAPIRPERHGLLILGGGPAGAGAALAARDRGVPVTLLDARQRGWTGPGETMHPGIAPVLEQLGVLSRVESMLPVRHLGCHVERAGVRRFEPFGRDRDGPWLGYQLRRRAFDDLLLTCAHERGTRVVRGTRALEVTLNDDAPHVVRADDGLHHSPFLIDATGGRHWLTRRLGRLPRRVSPRLVAVHGQVEGRPPGRAAHGSGAGGAGVIDTAPLWRQERDGWVWIARTGCSTYSWVRLRQDAVRGLRPDESLPPELATFRTLAPARGADVTWRSTLDSGETRFLPIGDAAAVLDPAASDGVLRAIMSGLLAGDRMARACAGEMSRESAVVETTRWQESVFEHGVERLTDLYGR